MKLLTVSGSSRPHSTNRRLLDALSALTDTHTLHHAEIVNRLPLFHPGLKPNDAVREWKSIVREADGLLLCTPEYLHNLPALLKNALEWLTTGGELSGKLVVALTATPHPPRGERAMQSLLWSLTALDASVLTQYAVYDVPAKIDETGRVVDEELGEVLTGILELFSES